MGESCLYSTLALTSPLPPLSPPPPPPANSPPIIAMQKKHAHYKLIREIKRLRVENTSLRNSVSLLKADLLDATQSSQESNVAYKKIYDEIAKRNQALVQDLEDKNMEIENLKQELETYKQNSPSKLTLHDAAYFKKHSSLFGYYDFDETHELNADGHGNTNNNGCTQMDNKDNCNIKDEAEDDANNNDDNDGDDDDEPFESFIPSYIHQAMLSKLTSNRVRLDLDNYIIKYEASQSALFSALAISFIDWLDWTLLKNTDNNNNNNKDNAVSKLFMTTIQTGIAGFWQEILCHFADNIEAKYTLLKDIEQTIEQAQQQQGGGRNKTLGSTTAGGSTYGTIIAQHFYHLLLMLYKHHIVNEEATVLWWQNPSDNEMSKKLRDTTLEFVNWLQDSEEEDEEDSEDEEENSDDSEDEDSEEEDDDEEEHDDSEVLVKGIQSVVIKDDDDEDDHNDVHVHFEEDFIHLEHFLFPEADDVDPSTSGEDTDDAMLDNHSLHQFLNNLLNNSEYCICQFTIESHRRFMTAAASTLQNNLLSECSCKYMSHPLVEKKEKSVRIAM